MTTASKITMLRIVLIPVFIVLLYLGATVPAFLAFVLASLTDFADGYVARKYNQVTSFGKFVDPLADKMLVISCMAVFSEFGRFPAWALAIVLFREFAVSGLRMIAAESGKVIAAAWSGKIKTASTMVCLCLMLILPALTGSSSFIKAIDLISLAVIVLTTVWSGTEYFIKNWGVFNFKSAH